MQPLQHPVTELPLYPFLLQYLHTVDFPMSIKDAQTGQYLLANDIAARRYGLIPTRYCDFNVSDLAHQQLLLPEQAELILQQDSQVFESQQPLQTERTFLTADHFIRAEVVTKLPLLDHTQTVIAILTQSQDVTACIDFAYLFTRYQQYLPIKSAIRQVLSYLQMDLYFYHLPTRRELEVLLTMVKVSSAIQVGRQLQINHRTIEEYKSRLRAKLQIDLQAAVAKLRRFHQHTLMEEVSIPH